MAKTATAKSTGLQVGDKAPAFTLPADSGKDISLSDYRGKKVVLYFYPKDDTPGCTLEAKAFTAHIKDFIAAGAVVIGASKDDIKSHCKFRDKFNIAYPLVSDTDGSLCASYGVWIEKSMYGKKYMGIERATFLIDEEGVLAHIWHNVKADGHAEEVLEAVRAL
ncbi:MAG: thioredoxin-dependent thiol peroxidase [Alphaproteobacteria bacterium]|nr:thioredoxin-dependent thiol peroxidase [Alphaproteobacteria bacterium]